MGFNLFDEAISNKNIYDNPYPIYTRLQDEEPILWSKIKQAWVISKYANIKEILSKNYVTTKRVSIQNQYLEYDDYVLFNRFFDSWLMYKDGIEHSRIKKETHKVIANSNYSLLSGVEKIAENIIKKKMVNRKMDVVKEYSEIIAVKAMYNFFNIPQHHHDSFLNWSKYIINFMQGRPEAENLLDKIGSTKIAISSLQNAVESIYFNKGLYNTSLPHSELLGILLNIIVDGYEPISNSITNSIFTLLNNPVQLNELLNIWPIPDNYIHEMIRYDPPFQYIVRQALEDFEIDNKKIKKNDRVLLMIASANYDKDIFPSPSILDFKRDNKKSIAFGVGDHYCPGSTISISIVRAAIQVFLKHIPVFNTGNTHQQRYESLGSRSLRNLLIFW